MILNTEVHKYLTSLMGFFIRKGKKTKSEALFQNYILNRTNSNKKNLYALLKRCKIKTATYLHLIERRRGKRSKYRIKYLEKYLGEKRGLLLVGRSIYSHTKKAPRQFITAFNQDLENWSLGKHLLKQKYKELHILAKRHAPRGWFFKKNKYKKKIKTKFNKKIMQVKL